MKKLVLFLLSINFITINSVQITSCKINEKDSKKYSTHHHKNENEEQDTTDKQTDFIVDLNYNDNVVINTPRGWKGTLNDSKELEELTKIQDVPYTSFTTKQKEFIKKFTTAMHTAISKKSINKFNYFIEQKTFTTFDQLINTINLHNKDCVTDCYIDVHLELIQNHAKYPIKFEEALLKVYNTLCYFFGKNYGYKMLRTLAVTKKNQMNFQMNFQMNLDKPVIIIVKKIIKAFISKLMKMY